MNTGSETVVSFVQVEGQRETSKRDLYVSRLREIGKIASSRSLTKTRR